MRALAWCGSCSQRGMRLKYLVFLAAIVSAYAVAEAGRQAVAVDMRHVDLHVTPDVTLHVTRMRGHFVATGGAAPYLDDKRSYVVTVQEGEIALDVSSLKISTFDATMSLHVTGRA